jgi:hypothetical protein
MSIIHRENYTQQAVAVLVDAEALAADTTPAAVDLQGYDACSILISVGVGGITFSGTNKVEFVLTHSDDDSTYANVADVDMIGVSSISGGIIHSLEAAHAAATTTLYGYRGGKRYLKLLADFSGTHGTATPMSATAIKAGAHVA